MRFFGKKKEGFVLHYERGKHIRSTSFDVNADGSRFKVNVSALFLPLQLGEEARLCRRELGKITAEYVMPYGGDIFSLFVSPPLLNFFVMDITGHGFLCHKLTEYFVDFAIKNRQSPSLTGAMAAEWKAKKGAIVSAVRTEFEKAAEELRRKSYDEKLINSRMTTISGELGNEVLTTCQVFVDLKSMRLIFENYGHPDQYCVLMDHTGRVLGIKRFSTTQRGLLWLGPYEKMQEEFIIPKGISKFRIVMFSDAVQEQNLEVTPKDFEGLIGKTELRKLKGEYIKMLKGAASDRDLNDELLIKTIEHMGKHSPKQFVEFFYGLLLGMNKRAQQDDMTLVVADFEGV